MIDPMLNAAAEALLGHPDHLRWLSYADAEMKRLRDGLGLPTPAGYSGGMPNYATDASPRAQELRGEVERRLGGRLSPTHRVAVESVLDEIIAEAVAT